MTKYTGTDLVEALKEHAAATNFPAKEVFLQAAQEIERLVDTLERIIDQTEPKNEYDWDTNNGQLYKRVVYALYGKIPESKHDPR